MAKKCTLFVYMSNPFFVCCWVFVCSSNMVEQRPVLKRKITAISHSEEKRQPNRMANNYFALKRKIFIFQKCFRYSASDILLFRMVIGDELYSTHEFWRKRLEQFAELISHTYNLYRCEHFGAIVWAHL